MVKVFFSLQLEILFTGWDLMWQDDFVQAWIIIVKMVRYMHIFELLLSEC